MMLRRLIRALVCLTVCIGLMIMLGCAQAEELEVHFIDVDRNDGFSSAAAARLRLLTRAAITGAWIVPNICAPSA